MSFSSVCAFDEEEDAEATEPEPGVDEASRSLLFSSCVEAVSLFNNGEEGEEEEEEEEEESV